MLAAIATVAAALVAACSHSGSSAADEVPDSLRRPLPDTLRVGTLYSPTSYFIYREEPMGLISTW